MSDRAVSAPVAIERVSPRWPDVLLVVGLTVLAALASALGFFHLAWRWGTVPVPVSAIVLATIVWFLCGSAFRLTGTVRLAALPWVGCLVVIGFFYFVADNPGFSLPLRVVRMDYETNQATDGDWRGLLLLGGLVLTGAVQLSLLWASTVSGRTPRAAGAPSSDGPPSGGNADPEHVTPTTSGASGVVAPGPGWILEPEGPARQEQSTAADQTRNSRSAQK